MNAPYLTPVARPPHDPQRMALDARLGWRGAVLPGMTHDVAAGADGMLALQPLAGTGRELAEPSGAFGGLALPRWLAWLPDGRLLLLDGAARRLRVFDPCVCAFVPFACLRPGDLRLPAGVASIAAAGAELLLCVPGAHRVIVLEAVTGATRAVWTDPRWAPTACAGLPNGMIAVADPAQGGVHFCSRRGRALRFVAGLGAVDALAVDCWGHLYARSAGVPSVTVIEIATGLVIGSFERPEQVAERFAEPAVRVFADGAIDVGGLCAGNPGCAVQAQADAGMPLIFDASGNPLPSDHADAVAAYPASGVWLSAPLDSAMAACTWDRIALDARVPAGASITIETLCADYLLIDDELADPQQWRRAGRWLADPAGAPAGSRAVEVTPACESADYMLQSPPGRYCWLRLTLAGDTHTTPSIGCLQIDFPRISLRRYLPAVFGADPIAAEFTDRWLAVLDRGLRDIETQIDDQARLFDPMAAPAAPEVPSDHDFLALLAAWVGVTLTAGWPLARQRRFVQQMPRLYPWRGTVGGLRASLQCFLGLDPHERPRQPKSDCMRCVVRERMRRSPRHTWQMPRLLLEHFQLRRWMALDHARLSDAAKLWGGRIVNRSRLEADVSVSRTGSSDGAQLGVTQLDTAQDPLRDPFHVTAHRLSVFVPAACVRTPRLAGALAQFLEAEKPAHVQATLVLVEPRFRIGVQSMLGLDAVLGVRTAPLSLGQAKLGRATVLAGSAGVPRPPRQVGQTRVGMSTIAR
jgi:phage tail-like protein